MPLVNNFEKIIDPIAGKIFQNAYLLFDGFQKNDLFT